MQDPGSVTVGDRVGQGQSITAVPAQAPHQGVWSDALYSLSTPRPRTGAWCPPTRPTDPAVMLSSLLVPCPHSDAQPLSPSPQ